MKTGSFLIPALLVALITTTLVVISCSKNNSSTASLSIESINTTVQVNDSMRVTFKFKGGNLVSNNLFWSIRNRINQLPADNPSGADTNYFQLPSFSGNSGEIYFSLPWNGYLSETSTENDTDYFKFYITNNDSTVVSDTVTSPQIVVLYQ